MQERLLENWIDSASERSYQPVFVQMLAASGYQVLHSTRHCPQEYGKDILAIAPDGVGCAFQLKGDPGGKMGIDTYRKLLPQLHQLVTHRPSFPGFPSGSYRAYLVTNGEFHEEVQVAARELNDSGYIAKLELWPRGKLLHLCLQHSNSLWPSEIADTRDLLDLYMANARDPLPTEMLSRMLTSMLQQGGEWLTGRQLERACTSCCWATGISLSRFAEQENHYAVSSGWMACLSLLRAAAGDSIVSKKIVSASLALCEGHILDALGDLWDEVKDRPHLGEGNPLTDADIYHWRITVLVGLLSSLLFACRDGQLLDEESQSKLEDWLGALEEKPSLWGEGAIAPLTAWAFALYSCGKTERAKQLLVELLANVLERNLGEPENSLPTPYYTFIEVQEDIIGARDAGGVRIRDKETFTGSAYCVEPLMRLALMLGMPDVVRIAWPQITKLGNRAFDFDRAYDFWAYRSVAGSETTRLYPFTYSVQSLEEETIRLLADDPIIPAMPEQPWQVLMWWQVAPHRYNAASACFVAKSILDLS